MKRRIIGAFLLVGAFSGCVNMDGAPETGGPKPAYGRVHGPPMVPGVEGPYGSKVPMAAPYSNAPPPNQWAAMNMMNQNVPLSSVQMNPSGMMPGGPPGMGMPPTMMPPYSLSPPGVPFAPGAPSGMPPMPGAPPGSSFQRTSFQGMTPDSGVVNANIPPGAKMPGGLVPAQIAGGAPPSGSMFPAQRTQVFFSKPAGMKVYWFTQGADGKPNYSTTPLETPGRYNFAQAAIYRLKLTHIPGRPALELYPTLEVVPTSPKTNEFLAHNSVPIEFSEEDFKQVVDRNYIVKVIYLPDPQFQDAAGAGPDEIVSTRLEPGQDPIQEALRRGSILLVLRIGNIDQGLQHSPATTAPIPGGPPMLMKPPGMGVPPGIQIPFPLTPIAPGGMGSIPPNQLPPLPDGRPPFIVMPSPVVPPAVKPEVVPPAKKEPGKNEGKPAIPQLNVPPPPGLNLNNDPPFAPPAPNPVAPNDKGASSAPTLPPLPSSPVIPASTSNELVDPNDKGTSSAPTLPPLPTSPLLPASASKESAPSAPPLPPPPPVTMPTLPTLETNPPTFPNLPPMPPSEKK